MSEPAFAVVEPAATPSPSAPPWPLATRIGFRFLFSYFALYNFALLENTDFAPKWLSLVGLWHRLIPWLAHHILRMSGEVVVQETGSGDKTYDWLLAGTFAVVAAVATIVWSLVDRRTRYDRLAAIFRVFIRYHLAVQMIDYGIAKAIPAQFPPPGPRRFVETYGESSPMGILWAFMGTSPAYEIFGGLAELTGGVLVLFRRTATLGALVCAGVLTNVVMLNFCYDVPVKLFSSHLLFMALIVAAPDARRLADVLILHRPTAPRPFAWRPKARGLRVARVLVKLALVLFVVGYDVKEGREYWREFNVHSALYGVYDVESQGDTSFRVAFVQNQGGGLRTDESVKVSFAMPPKDGVVEASLRGTKDKGKLVFATPDADHIALDGTIGAQKIAVRLKRRAAPPLLLSRGFHLVSENPFNR